jgi:hypothetical protein
VTRRYCISALVALVVLALVACGGDDTPAEPTPEPEPTQVGSGPAEQALARYVESTLGKGFVEDCSTATAERDGGKICSTYRGERSGARAYVLGGTFSEGTQWAILEERNGQWSVVHAPTITPDNRGVPGIPWPLTLNVDVVVTGAAPCVNVREGPALAQRAVDSLCDGTTIRLGAGPATADNFQWWQVAGRTGWVVSDYLRYPDAAQ